MTKPATIETENLILRPFQPEDADAYYEAILSSEVAMRALPTGRPVPPQRAPKIIEGYSDVWDENGYGLWAVIHKQTRHLIGHCGFQPLDQKPSIELTYAFTPETIASDLPIEAVRACLRYAFETLLITEVVAVILPGNEGARRVYTRVGMQPQGKVHAYDQHLPYYTFYQGDFIVDKAPYKLSGGTE